MKTISTGLKSHLSLDTTTLCTCWKLTRRDGTVFALTDHDDDIILSGITYLASDSYTRTSIKGESTGAVDNLDVIGMLSSALITDQDIENGLYDYATIQMFLVNWKDLTQGTLALRQGWLGEVILTPTGVFKAELRGLTQAFSTQWGDLFSPICRVDLGDSKCLVDLTPITHTGTVLASTGNNNFTAAPFIFAPYINTNTASVIVSNTMSFANAGLGIRITLNGTNHDFTVDSGTGEGSDYATFINIMVTNINTANIGVVASPFFSLADVNAVVLTLSNTTVQAVVSRLGDVTGYLSVKSFSDGYFANGTITWLTGNNAGVAIEIKTYVANAVTLFLSMNRSIQAGDTFSYTPGCDKRRETCYFKFNNMPNFRGEPDMPGNDAMLTFPEFSQK